MANRGSEKEMERIFYFKEKNAYERERSFVGSEECIRDRAQWRG